LQVLFVGEALVGNDGVDQLVKFNRALSDLSEDKQPRLIDGIVLTKFDTIDDKVGAAISMTYSTGQPIMFVGVGQTCECKCLLLLVCHLSRCIHRCSPLLVVSCPCACSLPDKDLRRMNVKMLIKSLLK
jgi:hypothetical protein